ncbi:MAG: APC family permease [Actinocatenispora sp.]
MTDRSPATARPDGDLRRRIGAFQATTLNMSQMCGVGPFITIPAMVAAFGGPQAVIGWIAGAVLALADGLVWAELGAAMPGSGGTYIYLREAFQYRTGRLMPFLFVWTAMLFIPLIMSTGVVGFVQYLGYLWPSMSDWQGDVVGLALIVLIVVLLWRRIESIGKLTVLLWAIMIVSVGAVIVAAYTHFHASMAFTYPAHAFDLTSGGFWIGFAGGLTIGIYDYLGYNTTSYLAAEIRRPGRAIPRSIGISVLGIMTIYLLMQVGVLGVIRWQDTLKPDSVAAQSVASAVLERTWGAGAADVVTVLILVTALASVFVGLLGGSRVPYDAARDGVFFKVYARLHPRHRFPWVGLVTMGLFTAIGFMIGRVTDLATLIQLLTTVIVIVQALAQIVALSVLRRRQPRLHRPYRMLLYPLPSVIAFVGWVVIYLYADKNSPGRHPIELSLAWLVAGCVAFLIWARVEKVWPFGPKEVREAYLTGGDRAGSGDDPGGHGGRDLEAEPV